MRFIFVVIMGILVGGCLAMGAAPVTVADFGGAVESPEASSIWLILAGEGTFGAILFGILGVVWKIAKPYLDEWASKRRLDRLLFAVESGVSGCQAIYVEGMKSANKDGKLTDDEKKIVFSECKRYIVNFLKTQGVDVIREYGDGVVDWLIESILSRLKLNNALAKAVVPPLPDLAP